MTIDPASLLALASYAPSALNAVSDVLAFSPESSPSNESHPDPAGGDNSVVSATSSAARPPISVPSPVKPRRSDLIRTFQWNCYDLMGLETGVANIDVATKDILLNLARPYNYAFLTSLFVELMPTHAAIKYPVTVELLWAPESASVDKDHVMNTYGATRLVAGSILNPSNHQALVCDLHLCNPIIKAPVAFNNRPRLWLKFWENSDSKALGLRAPISGSLFIKGSIQLVDPAICATY